MMRSATLIFCFCFVCLNAPAQLRHYFSLNTSPYANFFNTEKEDFGPLDIFIFPVPKLSYKIEKGRNGIEAYYTYFRREYHKLNYGEIENGEIIYIHPVIIGINYHYNLFSEKYLTINPFAGLNYGWYTFEILELWFSNPPWHEALTGTSSETALGIQTGLNLNAPVWKGLYANGNLRFTAVPWAKYDLNRHNMIAELGIGYKLQRRKEK